MGDSRPPVSPPLGYKAAKGPLGPAEACGLLGHCSDYTLSWYARQVAMIRGLHAGRRTSVGTHGRRC